MSFICVSLVILLSHYLTYANIKRCNAGDCIFDCRDGSCRKSILFCTNNATSCLVNCSRKGSCKETIIFSGAKKKTNINCNGQDSCINSKFICGPSSNFQSKYLMVNQSDLDGVHEECNVECGDVGCKESHLYCEGNWINGCNLRANYSGSDNFKYGYMECLLPNQTQTCSLDCGKNKKSCLDALFKCFNSNCTCHGKTCAQNPIQITLRPSNKPKNPTSRLLTKFPTKKPTLRTLNPTFSDVQICNHGHCRFNCISQNCNNKIFICTNLALSCTLHCGTSKCQHSKIYSAALGDTIINCANKDACQRSEIYCGDYRTPFTIPISLNASTTHNKCTLNCAEVACKTVEYYCKGIWVNGCHVETGLISENNFEESYFYCEMSDDNKKCILNCPSDTSCKHTTFDCIKGNCSCNGYCEDSFPKYIQKYTSTNHNTNVSKTTMILNTNITQTTLPTIINYTTKVMTLNTNLNIKVSVKHHTDAINIVPHSAIVDHSSNLNDQSNKTASNMNIVHIVSFLCVLLFITAICLILLFRCYKKKMKRKQIIRDEYENDCKQFQPSYALKIKDDQINHLMNHQKLNTPKPQIPKIRFSRSRHDSSVPIKPIYVNNFEQYGSILMQGPSQKNVYI